MPLVRLTTDDIDKLAKLLVMAVSQNAPIHRGKDGQGPKHIGFIVVEDALALDNESLEQYKPDAYSKHHDS